jgi:hypothetical protein
LNPGRRRGKLATNRLSYGAAFTGNYWVFALYPSSDILQIRKRNFSENGCFLPEVKGETRTLLSPVENIEKQITVELFRTNTKD